MPSPFPGIDPYLESQNHWRDFHAALILYSRDALNDLLPEPYVARIDEELHLVELADSGVKTVFPDVAVIQGGAYAAGEAQLSSTVATLDAVTIDLPAEELVEVRDLWIEIHHLPDRSLVTAVEILSPTNKAGAGYWDYLAKRRKFIRQNVHLVELDLLVRGRRLPMKEPLPPGDHFALVSRAARRPKSEVYAWSIRQSLPKIPIPLLTPDPDVTLDLHGLFSLGYERGRYARTLDYSAPLDLPLAPADRAWAEELAETPRA